MKKFINICTIILSVLSGIAIAVFLLAGVLFASFKVSNLNGEFKDYATAIITMDFSYYEKQIEEDMEELINAQVAYEKEKAYYNLSYEYMDKGYCVNRKEVTITDNDTYNQWKKDITPFYGRVCEYSWADDILTIENVDDEVMVYYLKQNLNLVPLKITEQIKKDGWVIKLTGNKLIDENSTENHNFYTNGTTNWKTKEITIYADEYSIRNATLHEIGHVVAIDYADKSLEEAGITDIEYRDFVNMYIHNADGNPYIYLNYDEIMAEIFNEFCLYPLELEKQSPAIYNIYEEITSHRFTYDSEYKKENWIKGYRMAN